MTNAERVVNNALDAYLMRRGNATGFRAATLARIAGVPTSEMSLHLQSYRYQQARTTRYGQPYATRYVIAATGYGRAARWSILAKPGSDPKVVRQARVDQARHITEDAVTRYLRDRGCEVPDRGTPADAQVQAALDGAVQMLEGTFQVVAATLAQVHP